MRDGNDEPSSTERLIHQAVLGDGLAMNRLLQRYRHRLKRLVAVRMSDEVRARVDASDVV